MDGGFGGGFDFGDLGDIFDMFGGGFGGFGGSRRANPNAPRRGADLHTSLTIDFFEACKGAHKEVRVTRQETCDACHGNGCEPGHNPQTCPECNGTGQVRVSQRTPLGRDPNLPSMLPLRRKGYDHRPSLQNLRRLWKSSRAPKPLRSISRRELMMARLWRSEDRATQALTAARQEI